MKLSMISAMAHGRVIGTGHGGIPWHLPRDVKHFREYTQGKHLLLGRRTFEEMLGWFTDHHPIVLTHDTNYDPDVGAVAQTMESALDLALSTGAQELVVCGGSELYHTALPYADELILTLVEASVEGTVLFPDFEKDITWEAVSEKTFPADEANSYAMRFLHLRRLHPAAVRTEIKA